MHAMHAMHSTQFLGPARAAPRKQPPAVRAPAAHFDGGGAR
jgi:hypothetical protein